MHSISGERSKTIEDSEQLGEKIGPKSRQLATVGICETIKHPIGFKVMLYGTRINQIRLK